MKIIMVFLSAVQLEGFDVLRQLTMRNSSRRPCHVLASMSSGCSDDGGQALVLDLPCAG
jgi:hypothetical protein